MAESKAKRTTSWVLAVLLAAMFAVASLQKLTGGMGEMFENWGYPAWFAILIGAFELAGAIGLLLPRLTFWAVVGLTGIMFGAAYTHLANGEGAEVLRPLIFLALLWSVAWLRRGR